jgi:alkane 1-monooxygenase
MSAASLAAPAWSDKKRYLWLLGIVVMGMPFYGYGLYLLTGSWLCFWAGPLVVYGVLPLADMLVGEDDSNPPDEAMAGLVKDRYYRYVVYAAIPVQWAGVILGAWVVATQPLHWYEWLGMLVTVGVTSGLAINVGHELGHQTDPMERWLAKFALAPVLYGHFYVEHNRGHHVRVATFEDPASSRFGESFWEFLPRCVIGSIASAWDIEKQRLAKQGKGPWSWENDNLQSWAISAALFGGLTIWLGWVVLPFLLIQAAYGGSLLEVVNYLEHYGLLRQKKADGSYERCQPHHSWNSNHTPTNIFLYHLQRHSDHHAYPTRSFQTLRNFEGLPRLPNGYAGMIVVAYIPWLWFHLMDPRVVAHFGGDMSRANIKPSMREAVLAKYPAATA